MEDQPGKIKNNQLARTVKSGSQSFKLTTGHYLTPKPALRITGYLKDRGSKPTIPIIKNIGHFLNRMIRLPILSRGFTSNISSIWRKTLDLVWFRKIPGKTLFRGETEEDNEYSETSSSYDKPAVHERNYNTTPPINVVNKNALFSNPSDKPEGNSGKEKDTVAHPLSIDKNPRSQSDLKRQSLSDQNSHLGANSTKGIIKPIAARIPESMLSSQKPISHLARSERNQVSNQPTPIIRDSGSFKQINNFHIEEIKGNPPTGILKRTRTNPALLPDTLESRDIDIPTHNSLLDSEHREANNVPIVPNQTGTFDEHHYNPPANTDRSTDKTGESINDPKIIANQPSVNRVGPDKGLSGNSLRPSSPNRITISKNNIGLHQGPQIAHRKLVDLSFQNQRHITGLSPTISRQSTFKTTEMTLKNTERRSESSAESGIQDNPTGRQQITQFKSENGNPTPSEITLANTERQSESSVESGIQDNQTDKQQINRFKPENSNPTFSEIKPANAEPKRTDNAFGKQELQHYPQGNVERKNNLLTPDTTVSKIQPIIENHLQNLIPERSSPPINNFARKPLMNISPRKDAVRVDKNIPSDRPVPSSDSSINSQSQIQQYHEENQVQKIHRSPDTAQPSVSNPTKVRRNIGINKPVSLSQSEMSLTRLNRDSYQVLERSMLPDAKKSGHLTEKTNLNPARHFEPVEKVFTSGESEKRNPQQSQPGDYSFSRSLSQGMPMSQPMPESTFEPEIQRSAGTIEKEAAIRAVSNVSVQRQVEPVNLELARIPVRRAVETPPAEQSPAPAQKGGEQKGVDIDNIAIDVYKILKRRLLHERERALGVS